MVLRSGPVFQKKSLNNSNTRPPQRTNTSMPRRSNPRDDGQHRNLQGLFPLSSPLPSCVFIFFEYRNVFPHAGGTCRKWSHAPIQTGDIGALGLTFWFATWSGLPLFEASCRAYFSLALRCCGVCAWLAGVKWSVRSRSMGSSGEGGRGTGAVAITMLRQVRSVVWGLIEWNCGSISSANL